MHIHILLHSLIQMEAQGGTGGQATPQQTPQVEREGIFTPRGRGRGQPPNGQRGGTPTPRGRGGRRRRRRGNLLQGASHVEVYYYN